MSQTKQEPFLKIDFGFINHKYRAIPKEFYSYNDPYATAVEYIKQSIKLSDLNDLYKKEVYQSLIKYYEKLSAIFTFEGEEIIVDSGHSTFITDDHILDIMRSVFKKNTIKKLSLDFSKTGITQITIRRLCDFLETHPKIAISLNLSDCHSLFGTDFAMLMQTLEKHSGVEHIDLSNNFLIGTGKPDLTENLSLLIKRNKSLKTIDITNTKNPKILPDCIARALEETKAKVELKFFKNPVALIHWTDEYNEHKSNVLVECAAQTIYYSEEEMKEDEDYYPDNDDGYHEMFSEEYIQAVVGDNPYYSED